MLNARADAKMSISVDMKCRSGSYNDIAEFESHFGSVNGGTFVPCFTTSSLCKPTAQVS